MTKEIEQLINDELERQRIQERTIFGHYINDKELEILQKTARKDEQSLPIFDFRKMFGNVKEIVIRYG